MSSENVEELVTFCIADGNVKWDSHFTHFHIVENNMMVPQIKEFLYNPAILHLGICPRELKTRTQTNICTPMLTAALLTIAKAWKQPKYTSKSESLDKIWYIRTMEYYSALRRNEILTHDVTPINL